MPRGRKKTPGNTCIIEGCTEPRYGKLRRRLCRKHINQQQQERAEALRVGRPNSAASVYAAWERGDYLGIVKYEQRRVYGLKPVANGYAALVEGLDRVLLPADAPLRTWQGQTRWND